MKLGIGVRRYFMYLIISVINAHISAVVGVLGTFRDM